MPGIDSISVSSAWKERIQSSAFSAFFLDAELRLTNEAWALVRQISYAWHLAEYRKQRNGSWFSILEFPFVYKKNPSKYPDLLHPDSFLVSAFTASVSGNRLEDNFFLGYFRKLNGADGAFFCDPFGRPIEPIPPLVDIVARSLDYYIKNLRWGIPGEINLQKERLIACRDDLLKVLELFAYALELVDIAKGEKIQGLKTGHVLTLVSGLYPFILYVRELVVAIGLVSIGAEGLPPLIPVLDRLVELLRRAILAMTAEAMEPVLRMMASRLAMREGRIRIERIPNPVRGLLGKFIDALISVFRKKEANAKVKEETPKKEKEHDEPEEKPALQKGEAENRTAPAPAFADPRIDCGMLIDIQEMLLRFNQLLRNELTPEYYENGGLKTFKAGFDQWDVPSDRRRIDYSRIVPSGKLIVNNQSDARMGDQMIVDATYWLYDRVAGFTREYDFRREGTAYWKAKRFLDELKTMIVAQRAESDSIRKYATFQQFRTSVRRLFASNTVHSKYYNLLNQLSDAVERASRRLMEEEDRLKKEGKI